MRNTIFKNTTSKSLSRTSLVATLAVATTAVVLSGCATYVQPMPIPIARLSPEQLAAINSNDRLSEADKQRLTDQNQQILNNQAAVAAATTVITPAPIVVDPWYGYGYPGYYPYPGFAPFYPGISLSLGYVWGRGGYRGGYGGGWRGHR